MAKVPITRAGIEWRRNLTIVNRTLFSSCFAAVLLAVVAGPSVGCNRDPNYAKKQYLDSGNKYFDRGRYKEALIMYRKALAKDPKYAEGYYRLSKLYEQMGQSASLVPVLRRATELLPKGSQEWNESALVLGEILAQGVVAQNVPVRNKPLMDEVDQLQATLDAKAPNSFEAARLHAEVRRAEASHDLGIQDIPALKKDLEASISYLRKSLQIRPNDVNTSMALARALSLYGETGEAETIYRSLIDRNKKDPQPYAELYRIFANQKRNSESEEILKRAIANNPKDFNFRTLLAGYYFSQGNRTEMARVLQDMEDHQKEFPQAYITAGDFYARIRDYDMANKQYQEGAQKDKSRRSEYSKREIDVLLRQGKKDQAYAQSLELFKENPKDDDARAMRATFLLDRGETNQAINELQDVVTAKPQNFVARFNLGRAHAAKGEYEQAIQQYQESIKIRPDYLRPRIAMAEAELQIGNYDAALKGAQDTEKLSANNAGARLLEAVALMRLGRNDESRKILADVVARYPQFPEANLEYASLDAREKKYPEARDLFHKAYLENPADLRPLFGEAETWVAEKQPEKGLALIQTEVNTHPDRSDLLREYAGLKASVGQYDSAMGDYRALLQRFKDNPRELAPLYYAIAVLYRLKGDLKSSIEWMDKAKPLQPNNVQLLDALGEMETQLGETKEAQADYRSALALDPNNPTALNNLAFAIADTGTDLDEALTMANKAKQQLPKADEVNDTLGWIYIKKHMGDPAADIFRELTARHPENPTYHYHYCLALYEKADKVDALKECNLALATKPPTKEELDSVHQLLAKLQ